MVEKPFGIVERDDANNITARYIRSPPDPPLPRPFLHRLDAFAPERRKIWQRTLDVFLPAGYPHSVTDDYLDSSADINKDSLQAFSSSIAGLISSRAVLSSVGVGDSSASPTAALLLSIFQESTGRVATILFAHRFGRSLEPECKMYRLLADCFNDVAFILDCISPSLPKPARVLTLSGSSMLRALCGVAAGSAKASLSAHFARSGNLGELNAKDSSQETVISLLGMLVGSLVVSYVTGPAASWTTLIVLLAIHLETNRRAVRAVSMRSLNRQRATLVFHHLTRGHVPTPKEISREERIFERDGVLRDKEDKIVGRCTVGVGVMTLLNYFREPFNAIIGNSRVSSELDDVLALYDECNYILWWSSGAREAAVMRDLSIILKQEATSTDILKAWWQALAFSMSIRLKDLPDFSVSGRMTGNHTRSEKEIGTDSWTLRECQSSLNVAEHLFSTFVDELRRKGWDLETAALETRASTRFEIAMLP